MTRPDVRPDWPGRLVHALTGEQPEAPASGPAGGGRAGGEVAAVGPGDGGPGDGGPGDGGPGDGGPGDGGPGDGDGDPVARARDLLAATGWDGVRLNDHARGCREAGRPWPHPLPAGWLAPGEHARYQALLHQLVAVLVPARRPTPGGPAPGARDRALMADRPPHW